MRIGLHYAKYFWYRIGAVILGMRSNPTRSHTIRPSPNMRTPQEISEIIIAHLTDNLPALRSCSLTCYSWYIAAVPHLYTTLTVDTHPGRPERQWPNPIIYMHIFDLLPFVKTLRINSFYGKFSPKLFNTFTLRQFSALANVQTLNIDDLDIPSFIPNFQQYFGPFMPTVRSLRLEQPEGSNRQIIFFIGLFEHLDDLSLIHRRPGKRDKEDLTLIPLFTPPLRGRLRIRCWRDDGLFQEMVSLFKGIKFRVMEFVDVGETQFLLYACVKTLQVFKWCPDDRVGKQP